MEVLIAILAMGIGVVSLMSLFPLSVIRTAQAHQLTVGTGLRLNAEAFIDNHPNLWIDPDADNIKIEHEAEAFFLDPLGFAKGLTNDFGGAASLIERYHANYDTQLEAQSLVVYEGNWLSQVEELGVASTVTSVTFGPTINLSAVPNVAGPIFSRVVVFDGTGKLSATRTITSIAGQTVNWNGNVTFTIARARVETQDEQFSWALTVRREDTSPGNPSSGEFVGDIFMPVFFRREFSEESESVFIYQPNFPPDPAQDMVFKIGSTTATLTYDTGARPAIKKGGYVFDAENGFWYRVSDYEDVPLTMPNRNKITMTLEFPAQADSEGAVFFKGLVDVYFLGTKQVAK